MACLLLRDGCSRNTNGHIASPAAAVDCAHAIRTKVLKTLTTQLEESYRWFRRLPVLSGGAYTNESVAIMVKGIRKHHQVPAMESALDREAANCLRCQQSRPRKGDKQKQHLHALQASDEEERNGLDGEEEEEDGLDEDNRGQMLQIAAFKRRHPRFKNARITMRGMEGREIKPLKVVKEVEMIELEPQRFEVLPRNHCRDFDDYYNGPTLEDQRRYDADGWQPDLVHDGHRAAYRSVGETFRDQGFRCMPEFAQMFANSKPQKVREHCFPKVSRLRDITGRSQDGPDTVVYGMREMNEIVKNDPGLMVDVFVKGKIQTEHGPRYIKLDVGRDTLSHNVTIKKSVDIDSIIIVMHKLTLSTDVEVSVIPTVSQNPPLTKSNHTSVRLLQPQSAMDKGIGGREEWYETTHSLSQIPHMHFGKVDHNSNVIIVFPRMKHQNPLNGRSATLIPQEIQYQFLSEVLCFAMAHASDEAQAPYICYDIDTWKWKSATPYGFKKTVVLQQCQLSKLQEAMERRIRDDPKLVHFGSFFFLMEAKGIKLHTMTMDPSVDIVEVLKTKFPRIDFDTLSKRENGQVLMDIGLGYHPVDARPTEKEPMMCLWDLERIEKIFRSAGYNQGTIHHANTMAWFGGRQSEMRKDRAPLVQCPYRCVYCLFYEPFRKYKGGQISFCDNWDAYYTNQAFSDSLDTYERIMEKAKKKSLGVGMRYEEA